MASIVRRGKTFSVVYYEGTGKDRHQVWNSGLSYTAAKALKAKLEHEGAEKVRTKGEDMTVSEFLYEFIEKYGAKRWVSSTYEGNVGLLENYVHPYLGDKKLKSIRTKTVDDYYDFLLEEAEPATNMGRPRREHVTVSTIHDIHKVVRCAFNLAVKWDYIGSNPFLKATLPEHKEKERKVLEPEQVLKILDFTCRTDYYDYYVMHCAIHLALACTMRGGEIGGLRWDHIDMEKQLVKVDRVIDRVGKATAAKLSKMQILFPFPNLYPGTKTSIVLKQPKTDGSIRDIEVPSSTLQALSVLKKLQNSLKEELGSEGYADYGLVICQANGRPIMTEHLNKKFKDILSELEDPNIDPAEFVFHSLRHTSAAAKLALSHGDYNSIRHAGGWANLEMLTRRYGNHSFANDRLNVAQKMDDFLGGNTPGISTSASNAGQVSTEAAEAALKAILQSNPELLIRVAQSIQNC